VCVCDDDVCVCVMMCVCDDDDVCVFMMFVCGVCVMMCVCVMRTLYVCACMRY